MPATASVLIHLGIVGAVLLVPGWAPMRPSVLMADLVEPDAPVPPPPARPPAPAIARDRRPLTPPRPIATPMPLEPPAPPRSEPEPPPPATPEPPPVATRPEPEPPKVAATERSARADAVSGTGITGRRDGTVHLRRSGSRRHDVCGAGAGLSGSAGAPPSSAARAPAITALPPDGVTQRATPRGGYQYLPALSIERAPSRHPGHHAASRARAERRARRRRHRQAVRRSSRSRPGRDRRGPSLALRAGPARRGSGGDVGAAPRRVRLR